MIMLNDWVTYAYYAMVLFFGFAIARNIYKTKNVQEAILGIVILIPFVLRLMRIK